MIKKYHVSKNLFDGTLNNGYYTNTDFDLEGAGGIFKSFKIYLVAGKYTIKWSIPVRAVREVNNGILTQNPFDNSDTWVFQVNSDGYFGISFRNMSSTQWDNSVTIMLNTGNTALPYEPYGDTFKDWFYRKYETATDTFTTLPHEVIGDGQNISAWSMKGNMSQSGTPTPSNPVYPQETGDKTANLFDKNRTSGIIINAYVNQSGEQITSQNYYLSYPIYVTEGDVYTWSFNSTTDARHTAPTVAFYDNADNLIGVATHTNSIYHFTFTVPSNVAYMRASVYVGSSTKTGMLLLGTVSEDDQVPLEFIPYGMYKIPILSNGNTYPIYLSEPIRKRSTYVDTAPSTGTANRVIKKLVFDGTENWFVEYDDNFYSDPIDNIAREQMILCSHQQSLSTSHNYDENCFISYSGRFNFTTQAITHNLTAWKQWLADQYAAGTPVTIWCVLATATTETFTAPTIPTSGTAQSFDVDTTLKPSEVSLTYHGWHEHNDTKFTTP